MSTEKASVSVLIRTRDIEKYFCNLLISLSRQTLHISELVVVDNFSTENELRSMTELLKNKKKTLFKDAVIVKLVPVTDEEFSYAYSANVGVFVAEGDFVCVTNGHCLPVSDRWLESGVSHFVDEKVAGVAGYTLPHKEGTIWEKLAFDWGWRKLNEMSRAYVKDNYFSTTNCILRRSLWKVYPFDEKMPEEIPAASRFGGEDHDWGLEMLARGYRIIVEPRFDVYHSHGETVSQLVPKYIVWRRIRKATAMRKRPRQSYTRLTHVKPIYYVL